MSTRVLRRVTGSGAGGGIVDPEYGTTAMLTAIKETIDLLMLGGLGPNIPAAGSLTDGILASATGDVDLLDCLPFRIDNTSGQFSNFADSNGASLIVQVRFWLRVSNAGISITPKMLYGATEGAITSVATLTTPVACSATNDDYSGANQKQTIAMALPSGANYFKPQITIAGTPADAYQAWAKARVDLYVAS